MSAFLRETNPALKQCRSQGLSSLLSGASLELLSVLLLLVLPACGVEWSGVSED